MLIKLFLSFAYIGVFTFGGGLAALPLIQQQVVELHGWMSMEQFIDLVSIAEMTPGPIAINSATFVGLQIAGIPGAVFATLGSVFPSCIIVTVLALLYNKYKSLAVMQGMLGGLRPAVVSLIASAGVSIMLLTFWDSVTGAFNYIALILFAVNLTIMLIKEVNPIIMLLCSGILGGAIYILI